MLIIKSTFYLCTTGLTVPVLKRKEEQRQWTRGQCRYNKKEQETEGEIGGGGGTGEAEDSLSVM